MSDKKDHIQLLTEISEKLDRVLAVMAIQGKEQNEQIKILRDCGFDWKLIGDLVGLKPNTARMRIK